MVCIRCKLVLAAELDAIGIPYTNLSIGEVELPEGLSHEQHLKLNKALKKSGLEIIDDKKSQIIESIKNIIIENIHYSEEEMKFNFVDLLPQLLHYDYTYLSNIFSEVTGTTINHFVIVHKIERAKELITYKELNLSEIAWKLNYSSVQHLSNQFKKITGLTPSHFKQLKDKRRNDISKLQTN